MAWTPRRVLLTAGMVTSFGAALEGYDSLSDSRLTPDLEGVTTCGTREVYAPCFADWYLGAWACSSDSDDRTELFEAVCLAVEERFYDPGFGGKDWSGIVREYRPRVATSGSEEAFYRLLNEMLYELGVSHLGVIPNEHPEWIGAPSVFSDGGGGNRRARAAGGGP